MMERSVSEAAMFEIQGVSIFVAFAAGLLSVASPCVLPLVPAYLAYLTGTSLEAAAEPAPVALAATSGGGSIAVAGPPRAVSMGRPSSPFLHSVSFVAGFTTIFVLFGIAVGIVGYFLRDNDDLILKIAGAVLIVMGLHLAGVITIPLLDQERRLDAGRDARVGYARSYVVGAAFSAGWSPCIGPTLGAIYALSLSSGTVPEAAALLLTYSLGLAVPFLALGAAYGAVKPLYTKAKGYVWIVNYLSGALLIIIGILIFTDSLINVNELFNWGFLRDVSGGA